MRSLLLLAAALVSTASNDAAAQIQGYQPPSGSIVIVTESPTFSNGLPRGSAEYVIIPPEMIARAHESCNLWYVFEYPVHFTPDEVIDAIIWHFEK